jgi:hypothetical protein
MRRGTKVLINAPWCWFHEHHGVVVAGGQVCEVRLLCGPVVRVAASMLIKRVRIS